MFALIRKSLFIEIPFILGLSVLLAVVVNAVRPDGMPWLPQQADTNQSGTGADKRLVVSAETAFTVWERGGAVFVDVRDVGDFEAGHIPGAVNVPLYDVLNGEVQSLEQIADTNAVLVLYCSDAGCSMSEELAEYLTAAGYTNVVEMPAGMAGWRDLGAPVEVGR